MENKIIDKVGTPNPEVQPKHKIRKIDDTLYKVDNNDDSDSLFVRIRFVYIFKGYKPSRRYFPAKSPTHSINSASTPLDEGTYIINSLKNFNKMNRFKRKLS